MFLDNDHAVTRWVDLYYDIYGLQRHHKIIFDHAKVVIIVNNDELLAHT